MCYLVYNREIRDGLGFLNKVISEERRVIIYGREKKASSHAPSQPASHSAHPQSCKYHVVGIPNLSSDHLEVNKQKGTVGLWIWTCKSLLLSN